ncbi:hypothetical protein JVU11DRAFT_4860 [Chiua virens]|nr:hypothetical protein JVU11DRAFT_4860 [Chiua virens]
MTTQLAQTHGHLSNRAKVRSTLERKPVFKSVLQNPFRIDWPSVPINLQNVVLARLVASLENLPSRPSTSRKLSRKKRISDQCGHTDITEAPNQMCASAAPSPVIGINAVSKALEAQLRVTRRHVVLNNPLQTNDQLSPSPPPLVIVFVCCADVDPPELVAHIPHLVAGCNSPTNAMQLIKLVPLPKGSESTISTILGVRRAAVIAFRRASPLCEEVRDILDPVPIVSAPWLCPSATQVASVLVPTHIKQLHTTAPKDMKAARAQRAKARTGSQEECSWSLSVGASEASIDVNDWVGECNLNVKER